jgi:hypothetical protein
MVASFLFFGQSYFKVGFWLFSLPLGVYNYWQLLSVSSVCHDITNIQIYGQCYYFLLPCLNKLCTYVLF